MTKTTENLSNKCKVLSLPSALLFDERHRGMTDRAKLLYVLLLNRIGKGFYDENGKPYQVIKTKELMQLLNCENPTVSTTKKELIKAGLLVNIRQEGSLSSRMYVKDIEEVEDGYSD